MGSNKCLLVFDTNVLNVPHDKRGDFTKFYFNSTFNNLADKIEALDIYQHVSIAIPKVVWGEMKEQKLKAYEEKLEQVRKSVNKFVFPFCLWTEVEGENKYEDYLEQQIVAYKKELSARQIDVIELEIPSPRRYESIVKRAFQKRPPFEGKETQSDKGFKDTLLWESILEYKEQNANVDILLYTNDKMFGDELKEEYIRLFEGSQIKIYQNNEEIEIMKELESIAKKVDEYAYIPPEYDDNTDVINWLKSGDFKKQVSQRSEVFNAVNKYISFNNVKVLDVYDIDAFDNELKVEYSIYLKVEVEFRVKDVASLKDQYDMLVYVTTVDGVAWSIEDLRIEESEEDE